MRIEAEFITSAAREADFPRDGVPEIALVGRSNVGKSSLINALVRQAVARTSAAPGKTRLANVYRVIRGASAPLHLVDLPGYGYAGGDRRELDEVTRAYFGRARGGRAGRHTEAAALESRVGQSTRSRSSRAQSGDERRLAPAPLETAGRGDRAQIAALLVVDSRHPGLDKDVEAWRWLERIVGRGGIVATKIDKLAHGQRIRAQRELESAFDGPVLPISAATGEGLDDLWKLIDQLAHQPDPRPRRRQPPRPAAPLPRK